MIFNVLGSCVSRDIFRFSKNHTVDINIQRNPISALKTQALKVDDSFLESAKLPNYEKRMLVSSVDRNCLKPIMESKAEWLIIDLAEERYANCLLSKKGKPLGYTFYHVNNPGWRPVQEEIFKQNGVDYEIIDFSKIDYDVVEKTYKAVIDELLEKYDPTKIIILENYLVNKWVDKNGKFEKKADVPGYPEKIFNDTNEHFKKLYQILFKLLPNSPVIKFPTNTICSYNHLWGGRLSIMWMIFTIMQLKLLTLSQSNR